MYSGADILVGRLNLSESCQRYSNLDAQLVWPNASQKHHTWKGGCAHTHPLPSSRDMIAGSRTR